MKDTHEARQKEVKRLQEENDRLERVPTDLALALAKAHVLSPARVDSVLALKKAGKTIEEIVKEESAVLDAKAAKWDIDRETVSWMKTSTFLAEFSRWIRKRAADRYGSLPVGTAAAVYNQRTEEVEIVYNPRFMASISDERAGNQEMEPKGAAVNEHEHLHLILHHVTSRRRDPHALSNISQDLAINSLISRCDTGSRLPNMLLLPGLTSKGPADPSYPKEVLEAREKMNEILADLPQEMASEWYFEEIKRKSEQNGYSWGKSGMKIPGVVNPEDGTEGEWVMWPSDQHGGWDDIPEELRDIVEGKIKHALRKATERADGSPQGWGNIPAELREKIRAYAFGGVDWKSVLKNWVGMRNSGGRSRSMKRIDRRAPYIMPGLRRNRSPKLLVMVDQSGSVDDSQLARIFGALEGCSKQTTFDVVPFDHTVAEESKFTWKRGQKPKLERVRGGGTSFDAAVDYINHPKNRGLYDGVIVCSDGECSQPPPTRLKLAWIITPGHKLLFQNRENELLIQMPERDQIVKSGW